MKIFRKSTCRPSILHRRHFSLPNSCSAGSKILRTNFGPFLYFWEIFRVFSNRPLHPLRVHLRIFFLKKKIVRHTEKPFLPKFKLSKCYTNEIGPKSKKGNPKNEKVYWKRVLTPNRNFSVAHLESITTKKTIGNRLRVSS